MAIRASIVLVMAMAGASSALAQASPPAAGLGATPDWTLDTGAPKAARRRAAGKGATAKAVVGRAARPSVSPEDASKAARLAERRAKFFAPKPEVKDTGKIPEFGGYNPDTMGDGSMRPGAMFKF